MKGLPDHLCIQGKRLPLQIRENAQAKRLTLRLCPKTNEDIILTLPPIYSQKQARGFIEKSMPWLEKQIKKIPEKLAYRDGMVLPIFGKPYELRYKPSVSFQSWWEEGHLLVHAPKEKLAFGVEQSLQRVAKQFLQGRTKFYAQQLGRSVNRVTLRDTRSRWGSCSAKGNISYSWRLVFAPEQIADYVCAHEVAHLAEMNHSPQFWKIVGEFSPGYKHHRQWLRQNGKSLFRYGDLPQSF